MDFHLIWTAGAVDALTEERRRSPTELGFFFPEKNDLFL